MITVGIIGGTGYTAGELIRLLINHPKTTLDFVLSTSQPGKLVNSVHQDLLEEIDITFVDTINPKVNVVFLCIGHGNSVRFLKKNKFSSSTKIIDLSSDYRIANSSHSFIYGLPEFNKNKIREASFLANPGC